MKLKIFFLSIFLFSSQQVAVGEEGKNFGRLRDGRAYRVNSEGVQLSDYIAELEVAVDDLRKRLAVVEEELEQREETIASLREKKSSKKVVKEEDLLGAEAHNCNEVTKSLEEKFLALQQKAERERRMLEERCKGGISGLEPAAQPVKPALVSETFDFSKKKDLSESKSNSIHENSTPEDVAGRKKEFELKLAQISELINSRKKIYDQLRNSSKGVSIQIQPLVTKSGSSLDSLRKEVMELKEGSPVTQIEAGLNEILLLLQEDNTLLARLAQ